MRIFLADPFANSQQARIIQLGERALIWMCENENDQEAEIPRILQIKYEEKLEQRNNTQYSDDVAQNK